MVEDARFEDAGGQPLRLQALDQKDLEVISSLVQDAVFPITEMSWTPGKRRFGLLLNRFRWEDRDDAQKQHRKYERVQSMLVVNDVQKVSSNGINRSDKDLILSVLAISFEPDEDGAGRIELTLAGDGVIALSVECLDISLADVTRPYIAPSRAAPDHNQEG